VNGVCIFRVGRHADIWCVIRNGAFFADYKTQVEAVDAAHAAARKEQALGCEVQVLTTPGAPLRQAEPRGVE
jgi:hypothetical protein